MPNSSDLAPPQEFKFGPFRVCVGQRLIEHDGQPISLGGRAMDILVALLERAGEVVSQRELIERVWPNVTVDAGNLRFNIAILRKALGDGVDGARYVINVPGRGYCFVGLVAASEPVSAPPVTLRTPSRPSIPSRLDRMVGRDADLQAITARLTSRRFVTIVGPGGIGKSTVAVSVAHTLAETYKIVCFVDLTQVSDPCLVASSFAAALGLVVQSDNVIPGVIGFLGDTSTLMILDGCEHLIDAVATAAEAIFAEADAVHILATSREPLRVEGEQVYRLTPLDCPPDDETLSATESLAFPAAQLFAYRVRTSSSRFTLRDTDAPIVARICQRLDGLALAIELAAGRVEALGLRGVEQLLDSQLSLLWQGRRTAPPRQQTLQATLDWSYNLLTPPELRILLRLVVFAGPFTLDAAEAVAGDDCAPVGGIAEIVASLVAKSLIVSDLTDGWVRYRLLDTTRAYLQGKFTDPAEVRAVSSRHADFFRGVLLAAAAKTPTRPQVRGLSAYAEHLGNVRAALAWSFSADGDEKLGQALAAASAPLLLELSLLAETRRWTERALASARAGDLDPCTEMELRAALGLSLMFTEGNGEAVRKTLARALELAVELHQFGAQLRLIAALHHFHTRIGDFRGSVGCAAEALTLSRRIDDPAEQMIAESMLGTSHHLAGDQHRALLYCREALCRPDPAARTDIARFGFDHRIRTLCALARAQWLFGAVDDASEIARYTIAEAEARGHPVTLCISRIYTVFVFLWRGDHHEAEAIIEQLIADTLKYALAPYHAVARALKGGLALKSGEAESALILLSDSLPILRAERHEVLTSAFSTDYAQALAVNERLDEAVATIASAVALVEGRGGSWDLAEMLRVKGVLLARRGGAHAAEAEICFRRSLELAREQHALSWELRTLTTVAGLWAEDARGAAARAALEKVHGQFTQGLETADLRAARDLLMGHANAAPPDLRPWPAPIASVWPRVQGGQSISGPPPLPV
jgi:predicted ATPase